MEKNNVIDIGTDTLFYTKGKKGEIIGVGDGSGPVEFMNHARDKSKVCIYADGYTELEKVKLKGLCIAWLALNYPDTLKFDDT